MCLLGEKIIIFNVKKTFDMSLNLLRSPNYMRVNKKGSKEKEKS